MILRAALPIEEEAWLEKCQELLLAEETRELAGKAAYLDFEPDGDWDSLPENLRMTWEGNTAAGIEAALKSILGGNDV